MRLIRVMRKELVEHRRNLLIYTLTVALLLLVQELADAFIVKAVSGIGSGGTTYLTNFIAFLFLGGFIITSSAFSQDMFGRTGQHNWLMLPASQWEKFFAKALLSAIAYPIALTLLFSVASVLIELLALVLFGSPFTPFNPISPYIRKLILHFVATQSLFLLGATYFRKAHFFKTLLAIGVIGIGFAMLTTLFARIAFAPYSSGVFGFHFRIDSYTLWAQNPALHTIKWIYTLLYWVVMPLFCWFVAYLRVKEVEATDAIQ